MDNEEAKFILRSFRPDGADAADPAFAEALAVAAANREVGAWLARERAADDAFATALSEVEIPEDLRQRILAVLAGEGPEEFDEWDAVFVGALAAVRPPAGLRDQIVAAMRMETAQRSAVPGEAVLDRQPGGRGSRPLQRRTPRRARTWVRRTALAASIALGAWVAVQVTSEGSMSPVSIEREAISLLEGDFSLDYRDENLVKLVSYLNDREMPAPETLPAGLQNVPAIGCKIFPLDEERTMATMVCFRLDNGKVVHMVTLKRANVAGRLPDLADAKRGCHGCKRSGWSSVVWKQDKQACVLIGKMDPAELQKIF